MAKANALIHAFHAIDRRHEGPNGGRHRIGVDTGAPRRLTFFIGQAEVGNAPRIGITVEVMFAVDEVYKKGINISSY